MISRGYGDIRAFDRDSETLMNSNYGQMPEFIDGILEGCTPRTTVVHGGEATYSHKTDPRSSVAWTCNAFRRRSGVACLNRRSTASVAGVEFNCQWPAPSAHV